MMRRRVLTVIAATPALPARRFQAVDNGSAADVGVEAPLPESDPTQIEDPMSMLAKSAVDTSSSPTPVDVRSGRFADYVAQEAASSLYRNALSDFDPFGGMAREDYFRDPSAGQTPRYAPRDFVNGGALEYTQSITSTRYTVAQSRNSALARDVSEYRQRSTEVRGAMRSAPAADAASYLHDEGSSQLGSLTATNRNPADSNFGAAFAERSIFRAPHTAVPGPYSQAEVLERSSQAPNAFASKLAIRGDDYEALEAAKHIATNDSNASHTFNHLHGLFDRDAWEEDRVARRQRMQFKGYDTHAGGNARVPLPTPVSPASMSEAQAAVRKNIVDAPAKITSTILAANTTAAEPALGAALVSRIDQAVDAQRRSSAIEREQQFNTKHGFGRKGTLVTDSGPDRRQLELHKNDERLYRAADFAANEYRVSDRRTDKDASATDRVGLVTEGVAHILDNKFDVDRRAKLIAAGRVDPLERSEMHYGIPVKQAVDNRVRFSGGRTAERPHNFFTPFPTPEDMQLFEVRPDVTGFPLFARSRQADRFEFELFERYRAHHQQRRRLALLHGLEPRASETIAERNARRAKLDRLCEATPFDERLMSPPHGSNSRPTVNVLRQWFGAYWLPSPTLAAQMVGSDLVTGVHVVDVERQKLQAVDRREHLLSSRFINCLLTIDALNNKLMRGYIKDALTACPEVELEFRQQHHVTRHFTPEQQRMYDEYVASETERHLELWKQVLAQRRFVRSRNELGTAVAFFETEVVTVRRVSDGAVMVLSKQAFETAAVDAATGAITLDDNEIVPVHPVTNVETPNAVVSKETFVRVKLDPSGETIVMTEADWTLLTPEAPSPDPNQHIRGVSTERVSFNRINYIEAQDYLWESNAATGREGWTQALVTDNIIPGTPVLARRPLPGGRIGDMERAQVVEFNTKPFFNPHPQTLHVRFAADDTVTEVQLAHVSIWQLSPDGPNRLAPVETREAPIGLRYVDVADPKNKRQITRSKVHVLDKYTVDTRSTRALAKFQRTRDVRDLDDFGLMDMRRAENHRLLSAGHRKDYIGGGYMHRYTPWEYIALQESEAPQIVDRSTTPSLRRDDVGPAYFHAPNRYWLHKRRPFGEIKNFYNEARDLFQYVDGITPWDTAKKLRTLWETREHHPTPYYNRPNLAMHRNTAATLPAHLWEADKRTGEIKSLKDTVKGYRPAVKAPAWIEK